MERIWRGAGKAERRRRRGDGQAGGEWRGLELPAIRARPFPLYMAGRLGLTGYVGLHAHGPAHVPSRVDR